MIKAVLFDLDGTLLPMDNDEFTKGYFKTVAKKFVPLGYDREQLVDAIWYGTEGMVKNDGGKTNEEVFWTRFEEKVGERAKGDKPIFDEFYLNEFIGTKEYCGYDPLAAKAVEAVKKKGMTSVLATNPIFPTAAVKTRVDWAGIDINTFELFTAYENSVHCKPNPAYYLDISGKLGIPPENCLMVGNDVDEDMLAAQKTGMDVFLITDNMINRMNTDISVFKSGGFAELINYINEL